MAKWQFVLPVDKAIAKVEEHCRAIEAELPKKPLHEIPYTELYRTVAKVLSSHRDWRFQRPGDKADLIPVQGDRWLYSHQEIGHNFILKRVVSQLIAEQLLPRKHENLFKDALGRLRYNLPLEFRRRQLKAFERLVKAIGEKKADKLIVRANELWLQHGEDYANYVFPGYFEKHLQLPRDVTLPLGDMFGNASHHPILTSYGFAKAVQAQGIIQTYRDALHASIKPHMTNRVIERKGKPPKIIEVEAESPYRMK